MLRYGLTFLDAPTKVGTYGFEVELGIRMRGAGIKVRWIFKGNIVTNSLNG